MKRSLTSGILSLFFLIAPAAWAKKHHKAKPKFDYYLLSLSWAPTYCADHPNDHSSECKIGGHTAFVLHGLWPQANSGAPPMACGTATTLKSATVKHMLQFMPTAALIQHEWAKHGTCSGLSQDGYFGQVEQAFTNVQVPDQFRNLNHPETLDTKELEKDFADANSAPLDAFRVSCHAKALVGVEVCLTKDLHYQACTGTVQECPSDKVSLQPTK